MVSAIPSKPNTWRTHRTIATKTTTLIIIFIVGSMGMYFSTSHNKTPTTIRTRTNVIKDIIKFPYPNYRAIEHMQILDNYFFCYPFESSTITGASTTTTGTGVAESFLSTLWNAFAMKVATKIEARRPK